MESVRIPRYRSRAIEAPFFRRCTGLVKLPAFVFLLAQAPAGLAQQQHSLPLVNSADRSQQGLVRIINRSDQAGTVRIHAIDDDGDRFGPIDLSIGRLATVQFNSEELEEGNSGKGLSGGVGNGDGDWRLELTSDLDIEALAYIRTDSGFVTTVHDVAQVELVEGDIGGVGDSLLYRVQFFNPGKNSSQVSRLRLINPMGAENVVTISARDDRGDTASGGDVTVTLAPHEARTITAAQLESGGTGIEGSLGTGRGKWQLFLSPELPDHGGPRPIQVVNLLNATATGLLANLSSSGPGNDPNRGGDGVDYITGGAGNDVLNPGDNPDSYDVVFGSAGNDRIVFSDSGETAYQALNYRELGTGINATINGATNTARVTKGSSGTDTIVDVANPMNASGEPPYGGFGIAGSGHNDTFTLTVGDGQWMEVRGEAGNDTINIRSGTVVVNYRSSTNGIHADLSTGRVSNDGFGGADTINGDVRELVGGDGNDTLLGSDSGDRLDGRDGDDVLNPRDNDDDDDAVYASVGNDRIVYTESTGHYQGLWYSRPWRETRTALDESGIVVTLDGAANTARVTKGSNGTDTIEDIANPLYAGWTSGGLGLYGTKGDDVFNLTVDRQQWMQVQGGEGNDTFNLRSHRWESESLQSGTIRVDYQHAPGGIDLDLRARVARDDGWGDRDTFTFNDGEFEIRGSDFSDTIRGSDGDDRFIGRRGNDVIDGRGGWDQLRFDRTGVQNVVVDLLEGTATGVWGGSAFLDTTAWWHYGSVSERLVSNTFSYKISNIEGIRGSRTGNDELYGSNGDDRLDGNGGDDTFEGRGGNDQLYGGDGDDIFLFGRGDGHDRIHDFADGEDVIVLTGLGITSKDQVLNNAYAWDQGTGVHIDLTSFGGGRIDLHGFHRNNFDASDFLI